MGTALLKLPSTQIIPDDSSPPDEVTASGVQKHELEVVQIYDVEVSLLD